MIIKLNEIPKEGQDYHYNQPEQEIGQVLRDLIHDRPFDLNFTINPIGNGFDIRGSIKTELPLVCSLCASEFNFPVDEKFHEVIVQNHSNKHSDLAVDSEDYENGELGYTQVSGNEFNAGDLFHEVVALTEPFKPLCNPACKGLCQGCGADLNVEKCHCQDKDTAKSNAFSVLKNIKLN